MLCIYFATQIISVSRSTSLLDMSLLPLLRAVQNYLQGFAVELMFLVFGACSGRTRWLLEQTSRFCRGQVVHE